MGERRGYEPKEFDTQSREKRGDKRIDRFCKRLLAKFGQGEFTLKDVYKIFNKIFDAEITRSKGKFDPSADFDQFQSTIDELVEKEILTVGADRTYILSEYFIARHEESLGTQGEDGIGTEDKIEEGDPYAPGRGFRTFSGKSK